MEIQTNQWSQEAKKALENYVNNGEPLTIGYLYNIAIGNLPRALYLVGIKDDSAVSRSHPIVDLAVWFWGTAPGECIGKENYDTWVKQGGLNRKQEFVGPVEQNA